MLRLQAQDLIGPRAYFTTFDEKLVDGADWDSLRLEAERKLKVLLLTKREVVCAASHLASPLAYAILRDNPALLTSGALTPALRAGISDVSEAVLAAAGESVQSRDMAKFYFENVGRVVSWPLEPNVEWFRAAMIRELSDSKSVLRRNLSHVTEGQVADMRAAIAGASEPLRDVMGELARSMTSEDRVPFLAFRELLYHMSGARVVNCESSLPQENFVDYGLADLKAHETMLSDLQVFYKLFFEFVFQSIKGQAIAVHVLDILTFDQVLEMRQGAFDDEFVNEYDSLTQTAFRGIAADEGEHVLLDMSQLMGIREALASRIQMTVGEELDSFRKRRSIEKRVAAIVPGAGIGATLLGVAVPPLGLATAGAALALDGPAFVINLFGTIADDEAHTRLQRSLQNKKRVAIGILARLGGAEKTPLVDAVVEVSSRAAAQLLV
jgi:hypothetical protein